MAYKGRRPSPKQQRELDVKMHQTLRSLMTSHYEREESARRAKQNPCAVLKEEDATSQDGVHLECDLELEARTEPLETEILSLITQEKSSPMEGTEHRAEVHSDPRRDVPEPDRHPRRKKVLLAKQSTDDMDGVDVSGEEFLQNEPLFDNEQKVQIQLDVDKESNMEELKALSLDNVCIRMAYFAHSASAGGDAKHSASWYNGMVESYIEATTACEYPRPHLPFEVERILDKYYDSQNEEFRQEEERNLHKLEKRSVGCTTETYECVFPIPTEDMVNNVVLLTGVTGNEEAFFKLYLQRSHIKDSKGCYSDCICLSVSPHRPNVLHFAAAYGNAKFIRRVLFPGDALPNNPVVRSHYKNMIDLWLRGSIDYTGQRLYPFDVAVFYDFKDCARELVRYQDCARLLRERKVEMSTPKCSLFYRDYITCPVLLKEVKLFRRKAIYVSQTSDLESPLSMAVYHGNMDMVKMLQAWQLIKPQHFPQAFREAANAGDVQMLTELFEMCGKNQNLMVEQKVELDRILQSPLHVAAAAGHLRAVQYLCSFGEGLRTLPDGAGDLPLTHAIENGHVAIADYFMKTYPYEVRHTVVRSAIACKKNRVAKVIFDTMMDLKEVIDEVRPLKFSVDAENFQCAEYFLRKYISAEKVDMPPWSFDVMEALDSVLRSTALPPDKKAKFVIAFQLAGVKISMVNVIRVVTDRPVAALICNSIRHPNNQPKTR